MIIERPLYLDKVTPYIGKDLIKVLVGIRRAGKSTILEQVRDILVQNGTPEAEIVHVNFDTLDYADVRDKPAFLKLAKKLYQEDGKRCFLFDEVQAVDGWDEVISALYSEKGTDIYITGSNSKLLSSELSTFLTGRYVDIRVSTLNFSEFIDFKRAQISAGVSGGDPSGALPPVAELFAEYQSKGGFPIVHADFQPESQADATVLDIYNSIVLKDLVERKQIRNTELLSRVVKYVFDNIGNPFSAKSVSDYLKSERRNLSPETIYNYLDWLAEAFIIDRVPRYDLRGKAHLKTQEKYYLGDVGLLYAVNGRQTSYSSGILENIVYHELISHGYEVSVGKNGDKEIDFVAEKDHRRLYLQVFERFNGQQSVIDREFGAFAGVGDNYPKYVLTMEDAWAEDRDGIHQAYLPDFILNQL